MNIWTCGSSPRSGSRNSWTRIKNVNGASRLSKFRNFFVWRDPNYFLSRLVNMDETWLYHCDPETKQQSMEWRNRDSPRPKKFSDFSVFVAQRPNYGLRRLDFWFMGHTQIHTFGRTPLNERSAHHTGRYILNAQQTHETTIHALSEIRNWYPSNP
jgi:hypothetical protein